MICFTVPGDPVGKGRPRAFRCGAGIRMHTPEKTARFEERVRFFAVAAGAKPMAGPLRVEVVFRFTMPPSRHLKKHPRPEEWKTGKPDLDNLIKSCCDALNGIAWTDDAQVAEVHAVKRVAAQGEPAGTSVSITGLVVPSDLPPDGK